MNRTDRFALATTLISLLLGSSASAHEIEYGTALMCDTQEQVERYVSLYNGEAEKTVNALNAEENDPNACGLGTVAFFRGPEIKTARTPSKAFQIVRILVVGGDQRHARNPPPSSRCWKSWNIRCSLHTVPPRQRLGRAARHSDQIVSAPVEGRLEKVRKPHCGRGET
jgi:hypothetical protein